MPNYNGSPVSSLSISTPSSGFSFYNPNANLSNLSSPISTWSLQSNFTPPQITLQPSAFLLAGGTAVNALGNTIGTFMPQLFGDSEAGQLIGGLVGNAVGTTFSGLSNNLIKGNSLGLGLGQDVGTSLSGAAIGLTGNYIGQGITKALGNSAGGRFLGQGVSSTIGSVGGNAVGNLLKGKFAFLNLANLSKAGQAAKFAKMNIGGMAGLVVGSALEAAFGKSKAYEGKYGKVTLGLDTAYDLALSAVGFVPGVGTLISGAMAVNKGLINAFGSTSGMTVQDSIFASPLNPLGFIGNWINMAGARDTRTFDNQSWLNTERTDSFMQNAFGDLGNVFQKARQEAGKTYGTFSRKAYRRAQNRLTRANNAWDTILDMTDQNEYQNIRSSNMASINAQRYLQMIQGNLQPLARGKNGMKLLSFATTGDYQNNGMRLLSRAALNSSGMRILSNAAI